MRVRDLLPDILNQACLSLVPAIGACPPMAGTSAYGGTDRFRVTSLGKKAHLCHAKLLVNF